MVARIIRSEKVLVNGLFKPATIVVEAEKIMAIESFEFANTYPKDEIQLFDFGDRTLIPGLVDTHVHINEPGRAEWEGFVTATQAAAAGGITTVVDMPLNCSPVTTNVEALKQKLTSLEGKLWIDCGFWGGVTPDSLDDLEDLIQAGVLGVKSFTIDSGLDEFPRVDENHVRAAIRTLANHDIPYLIHAELEEDAPGNPGQQTRDMRLGSYMSFLDSRPKDWENRAIDMMISLAEEAKSDGVSIKIHIVHLSSADSIQTIQQAKGRGLAISTETCPHYLTLNAESIPDHNPLFKCTPPIREQANNDKLWSGLESGVIDFVVSDHSPCTPALKHLRTGDLSQAWGGISSLQFGLPLIWTEARKRGHSLEQVVEWMSFQPAKFAGLGCFKGQIAVGFDADLVVFNEDDGFQITSESIMFRNKITPYLDRHVSGVVEATFLRGKPIFEYGKLSQKALGQPILRDVS